MWRKILLTTAVMAIAGTTYVSALALIPASQSLQTQMVSEEQLVSVPMTPRMLVSNTQGRMPLTVFFDGSFSDVNSSPTSRFLWNFGDGKQAEGKQVSHRYREPGLYQVTLLIEDSVGHRVSMKRTLVVGTTKGEAPLATIEVSPTLLSSSGRGVGGGPGRGFFFNATASTDLDGTLVSYEWRLGDGSFATAPTLYHMYTSPGLYRVFLLVTDNHGNSATASLAVRVS